MSDFRVRFKFLTNNIIYNTLYYTISGNDVVDAVSKMLHSAKHPSANWSLYRGEATSGMEIYFEDKTTSREYYVVKHSAHSRLDRVLGHLSIEVTAVLPAQGFTEIIIGDDDASECSLRPSFIAGRLSLTQTDRVLNLTRQQITLLLPYLQRFVDTGSL